jgi:hypothetical protein
MIDARLDSRQRRQSTSNHARDLLIVAEMPGSAAGGHEEARDRPAESEDPAVADAAA